MLSRVTRGSKSEGCGSSLRFFSRCTALRCFVKPNPAAGQYSLSIRKMMTEVATINPSNPAFRETFIATFYSISGSCTSPWIAHILNAPYHRLPIQQHRETKTFNGEKVEILCAPCSSVVLCSCLL